MPEIVVYLIEGRSLDEKRGLVKDVTAAVVKNIGVPPEAVVISLVEQPKTHEEQRRRPVQRHAGALARRSSENVGRTAVCAIAISCERHQF